MTDEKQRRTTENVSLSCDRCGGSATLQGWAFPAGGSFPVTACDPCVRVLSATMHVAVDPVGPSKSYRMCHGCLVDDLDHNCGYEGP